MEYLKEHQLPGNTGKKSRNPQSMTTKRRDLEAEKKECYRRIDASRPPICQGCGCRGVLSHSHRFPQAYENYRYIAVDESIDLYCMGFDNNCHTAYETGKLHKLRNGKEVMEYLMNEDYGYFMRKLVQMDKRISEERKKKWLQESQGIISIPEWCDEMIREHLNQEFEV